MWGIGKAWERPQLCPNLKDAGDNSLPPSPKFESQIRNRCFYQLHLLVDQVVVVFGRFRLTKLHVVSHQVAFHQTSSPFD